MSPRVLLIAVIAIWFFAPAPVGADAVFVGASPASNATVGGVVDGVQIVFNEVVSDAEIVVEGPKGSLETVGSVAGGQVISAEFEPLTVEGRYTVTYEVISADSDPVQGIFGFTYRVDGPARLPIAVPAVQSGTPWLTIVISGAFIGIGAIGLQAAWRARRLRNLRTTKGVSSDR